MISAWQPRGDWFLCLSGVGWLCKRKEYVGWPSQAEGRVGKKRKGEKEKKRKKENMGTKESPCWYTVLESCWRSRHNSDLEINTAKDPADAARTRGSRPRGMELTDSVCYEWCGPDARHEDVLTPIWYCDHIRPTKELSCDSDQYECNDKVTEGELE